MLIKPLLSALKYMLSVSTLRFIFQTSNVKLLQELLLLLVC